MSSNPSKSLIGTVLSDSETTFWINSFNTDLETFDSLFSFGVITSFAGFLRYLLFLAGLKTRLLFLNSSMRQTNAACLFTSEQLFMTFAKSLILLRTSFLCFKRFDGFLILISVFITSNRLKAS